MSYNAYGNVSIFEFVDNFKHLCFDYMNELITNAYKKYITFAIINFAHLKEF